MQLQIAQAEEKVDENGRNVAATTQAMTKAVAAAEEVSVYMSRSGSVLFGSVSFGSISSVKIYCLTLLQGFGFGFGSDLFCIFLLLFNFLKE